FGDEVAEWDTLRDPAKNANTAKLFKDMTQQELTSSVLQVVKVTPDQIAKAVETAGYAGDEAKQLTDKLVARSTDLIKKLQGSAKAAVPPPTPAAPPPPPAFIAPFDFSGPSIS